MQDAGAGRWDVGTGAGRRAASAALAGALVAAAWLAPAAAGVAPGANGRIAYHVSSSGTSERWVEQFDPLRGGPRVPVSHGYSTGGDVMADDQDPSWSPDGRLVLSGDPDGDAFTGNDLGPDLIVTDALGLVRTNITRTPTTFERDPAWSPDDRLRRRRRRGRHLDPERRRDRRSAAGSGHRPRVVTGRQPARVLPRRRHLHDVPRRDGTPARDGRPS